MKVHSLGRDHKVQKNWRRHSNPKTGLHLGWWWFLCRQFDGGSGQLFWERLHDSSLANDWSVPLDWLPLQYWCGCWWTSTKAFWQWMGSSTFCSLVYRQDQFQGLAELLEFNLDCSLPFQLQQSSSELIPLASKSQCCWLCLFFSNLMPRKLVNEPSQVNSNPMLAMLTKKSSTSFEFELAKTKLST